jgi:hypothetical protein
MTRAARSNGHTLALSYLEKSREKPPSIPAAARSHCLLTFKDLGILVFVFCCAVGQLIFGVY